MRRYERGDTKVRLRTPLIFFFSFPAGRRVTVRKSRTSFESTLRPGLSSQPACPHCFPVARDLKRFQSCILTHSKQSVKGRKKKSEHYCSHAACRHDSYTRWKTVESTATDTGERRRTQADRTTKKEYHGNKRGSAVQTCIRPPIRCQSAGLQGQQRPLQGRTLFRHQRRQRLQVQPPCRYVAERSLPNRWG